VGHHLTPAHEDVFAGTRPLDADALATLSAAPCPACQWWEREDPVFRDDDVVVHLATYAVRPGHLWVAPRAHVERHADLTRAGWLALQGAAHDGLRALTAYARPTRVYVAALGSAQPLTRTFPHVHLHVVPIYDGGPGDRPSEVFTWKHGMLTYRDDVAARWRAGVRDAWPT
jgi:diadenosine tetraphosphate (Ap4A) HIT family hydrolase